MRESIQVFGQLHIDFATKFDSAIQSKGQGGETGYRKDSVLAEVPAKDIGQVTVGCHI